MTRFQGLWKPSIPVWRFSLLLALFLLSFLVFTRVSQANPTNPVAKLKLLLGDRYEQHRVEARLNDDPKTGQQAPLQLTKWLEKQGLAGKPVAVLMIGACSECATSYLKAWSDFAAKPGAPAVVVFTLGEEAQVKAFRARHPEVKLTLAPEPEGYVPDPSAAFAARLGAKPFTWKPRIQPYQGIGKDLNAVFRPRVYYYGTDRALEWLQPRQEAPQVTLEGFEKHLGLGKEGAADAQD